MDKQTFSNWFRQQASRLGVSDVRLSFMTPSQAQGEYGRYEPGSNTILIDERQLAVDANAQHTALHELAHAIVFKRNSEYLERDNGMIRFNPNNNLATDNLRKLEFKGGHGMAWRRVGSNLGIDVSRYVDKDPDQTPYGQLRFGLGFRRR
jgi:hypothetical protein